jgi:DNA-binding IscR family transcriptional regulator
VPGDPDRTSQAICGQDWVWQEIYDDMRAKLASVSLVDLVEHEREHRARAAAVNYAI